MCALRIGHAKVRMSLPFNSDIIGEKYFTVRHAVTVGFFEKPKYLHFHFEE